MKDGKTIQDLINYLESMKEQLGNKEITYKNKFVNDFEDMIETNELFGVINFK